MVKKLIKNFIDKLFYLISPPFCEGCKVFIEKRTIFCTNCFDKIKPIVSTSLKVNSKYEAKVYAISDYKEPIKNLILSKINGNVISSRQIGELMWDILNIKNMEIDYFIPVPLHWSRFIKRGYNQTEIICDVLSEKKERPIANIVKRSKYTKYQSSLSHHLKNENVKNVFKLDEIDYEKYKNKNLIIVDDLLTSGSTVLSIAKELVKLNPKSINIIVACRVV